MKPAMGNGDTNTIREALRSLPVLAATSTGNEPKATDIFFPEGHVEALDPDVSLVIGNRGMGKTFWSRSLASKSARPEISRKFGGQRSWHLEDFEVRFGFADAEGSWDSVSQVQISSIRKSVSTDLIWRAVLIRALAPLVGTIVPSQFKALVDWVRLNPDEQLTIFRMADDMLETQGKRVLFLFDQLDQIATDWERIQELTKGLLKTALAMKSYRAIKMKIFMRPDQAEDRSIFRFPDGSKISGGRRTLTWRPTDLYGLLYFEIMKDKAASVVFFNICNSVGVDPRYMHTRLNIPAELTGSAANQARVFDLIAGSLMGYGSRRGRPYSWIPTHLADARGEISPRTFLKVMRVAAVSALTSMPETAIDFVGIGEGVREASRDRLEELEEDYPWISTALAGLKGLHVPCNPEEMYSRWEMNDTVSVIGSNYLGTKAPIDLVVAGLLESSDGPQILLRSLREVGVLEERKSDKVNIPDIFRVNAGILRKGGVAPQQRLGSDRN